VRDVVKAQGYLFNQSINDLCRDTGFSRRDLYRMFSTFKALCALSNSPTGIGTEVVVAGENVRLACFSRDRPDKDTLGRCIPVLGVEDEEFVSRVFTVLDFDGSGEIEWDEFIEAMAAMEKGSREKRAEFLFRVRWHFVHPLHLYFECFLCRAALTWRFTQVYDENEDGLLNEAEFCKYFVAGMGVAKDDPYAMEVVRWFIGGFHIIGCELSYVLGPRYQSIL
jgi:EF-hand domain pair